MNWKDILVRAAKTFFQAFIPVLIAAFQVADLTDWDNLKTIAYSASISAFAAGISAVWNLALEITKAKEKTDEK